MKSWTWVCPILSIAVVRISVYEEGGRTKLATIRPTARIGLFGAELKSVAEEVENTTVTIMAEAAR